MLPISGTEGASFLKRVSWDGAVTVDHETVWLSIDDVDWAIKYLYVQYMLKTVPVVLLDDPGPSGAPAAAGAPVEAAAPAAAGAAAAEPAADTAAAAA